MIETADETKDYSEGNRSAFQGFAWLEASDSYLEREEIFKRKASNRHTYEDYERYC